MNCEQARALLPDDLYAELPAAQRDELSRHLEHCPACAEVGRGLRNMRQLLNAAPLPPAVQVDLPLLYQEARELDDLRFRRWRRLAWASATAAAVLLIATIFRFEVRWDQHELVFGWGAPRPVAQIVVPEEPRIPTALLADLQLAKDLIHSIVTDMDERQQEHAAALANLEQRLDSIQSMSNRRWASTQNDFRALYTACFGVREKGAIP